MGEESVMVRFSGEKREAVTISCTEAAQLVSQGYFHLQIGTWDDGTPAFIKLEMEPVEIGQVRSRFYSRPPMEAVE